MIGCEICGATLALGTHYRIVNSGVCGHCYRQMSPGNPDEGNPEGAAEPAGDQGCGVGLSVDRVNGSPPIPRVMTEPTGSL